MQNRLYTRIRRCVVIELSNLSRPALLNIPSAVIESEIRVAAFQQNGANLTPLDRCHTCDKVASVTGRVARCVMARRTFARLVFRTARCSIPCDRASKMRDKIAGVTSF